MILTLPELSCCCYGSRVWSLHTMPCSTCVVLSFYTSESKGRVGSCAWEKSEEILPLLLGLKDEGHSTKRDGGKGISDAKILLLRAQVMNWMSQLALP